MWLHWSKSSERMYYMNTFNNSLMYDNERLHTKRQYSVKNYVSNGVKPYDVFLGNFIVCSLLQYTQNCKLCCLTKHEITVES